MIFDQRHLCPVGNFHTINPENITEKTAPAGNKYFATPCVDCGFELKAEHKEIFTSSTREPKINIQ